MQTISAQQQDNQTYQDWPDNPDTLVLLDLRLKAKEGFIGKLSFTASIHLNHNVAITPYLIDKITMVVGYPDSNRIITFKNSGTVINSNDTAMKPMIWLPGNPNDIYKTVFTGTGSNIVNVKFKVLLNLREAALLNINDSFSGDVDLRANYGSISTCLVTVSMNSLLR
jgi:hypothetical protein